MKWWKTYHTVVDIGGDIMSFYWAFQCCQSCHLWLCKWHGVLYSGLQPSLHIYHGYSINHHRDSCIQLSFLILIFFATSPILSFMIMLKTYWHGVSGLLKPASSPVSWLFHHSDLRTAGYYCFCTTYNMSD